MEEWGIQEGDEIEIEGPGGVIRAFAYLHPGVSPEVVCVPTGQGHTHYGDFEVGPDLARYKNNVGLDRGGNVFAVLSQDAKVEGTGALAWAGSRVRIRKTGNTVRVPKFEGPVYADFALVEELLPISKPDSSH